MPWFEVFSFQCAYIINYTRSIIMHTVQQVWVVYKIVNDI